jgi:hypothetical protein
MNAMRAVKQVLLALALTTTGCPLPGGGAQAVLKAPVTSRCEKAGLEGCADLVDGTIAYAEGDSATGEVSLRRGLAANLDKAAELEDFAVTLDMIGKAPGAGKYVTPLQPAIELIKEAAKQATEREATPPAAPSAAVATASSAVPAGRLPRPSNAEPDEPLPDVADDGTLLPVDGRAVGARATTLEAKFLLVEARESPCPPLFPEKTACLSQGFRGKTSVKQVLVSQACPNDVVISAGTPRMATRWLLWVPAGKGLDLREAGLPLTRYDSVTVGVVAASQFPDARCGVNVLLQ